MIGTMGHAELVGTGATTGVSKRYQGDGDALEERPVRRIARGLESLGRSNYRIGPFTEEVTWGRAPGCRAPICRRGDGVCDLMSLSLSRGSA